MILHVTGVEYLKDYQLKLTFNNGDQGVADLSQQLWGTMFEPLKDKTLFCQVKIDPELDTVVWGNGADLAPEFLHQLIKENTHAE